jgi:hypothetical protein
MTQCGKRVNGHRRKRRIRSRGRREGDQRGWTEQRTEALVLAVSSAGIGAVLAENVTAASKPEAEAVTVVAVAAAAACGVLA